MFDEAESRGIHIDLKKLEDILNIPVIPTKAKFGKGVKELSKFVTIILNIRIKIQKFLVILIILKNIFKILKKH
jgi:ferrous iron transport protein B